MGETDHMKTTTCQHCNQPFDYEPAIFAGREFAAPIACDACVLAYDEAQAREKERERIGELTEAWNEICPPLYRDTNPNDPRLSSGIREALTAWGPRDGMGLALCGVSGKGKTRLAFHRLRALHFDGVKVYALSAKRLEHMIHMSFSDAPERKWEALDVLEKAREARVLLLDDVGKEKFTERVASEFYDLIEYRTSNLLPTIWTANTSRKDLAARLGDEHGSATMRRLAEFSEFITV